MKKKVQKRKLYKTSKSNELEYMKVIKIFIVVILIIALTYFVTALMTGEIRFGKKKEPASEEVSIQYDEITAGQVFSRSDSEYYVLCYNFSDSFSSYYLSFRETYVQKENSLPIYLLDLEKSFNQEMVLEEGENYQQFPSAIADLKVANPTMLKIKNHKVVERIIGLDDIIQFFQ